MKKTIASFLTLVIVAGSVPVMISSCAKKDETGYYSVEVTSLGDNETGYIRNNVFMASTDSGEAMVSVISDAESRFFSGSYTITIDGDEYYSDGTGDYLTPDSCEYEINGHRFCEVTVISDSLDYVTTTHYSVGKDNELTEDDDIAAGMTDIATTDVFQTSAGTCLLASDDVFFSREDGRRYMFYYSDDPHEPLVYDLDATLGEEFTVDSIFSDNGSDLLISGTPFYSSIRSTYRIDPDTGDCTDETGMWPMGYFRVYDDGDLYFYDCSGIYLYDDGSYEQKVDYSKCDFNISKLSDMELVGCEDGGYQLTYVDYSTYDYVGKRYMADLRECEDPTEGKTVVEVGITGYVGYTIGDLICSYNDENTSVYLVPYIIDPWSLDQRCTCDEEIPEDLDEYGKTLYMAKLESDAIAEYISGPDAPDVLISDGIRMNLQREGLLDDLSSFVDTLSTALAPGVIDASYLGDSIYQIPLYYYIVGIAEYSNDNAPSEYKGIGYYDYSAKIAGDWDGTDPMAMSMNKTDYAEELISCQYDLFFGEDMSSPDFHNAAFYALLEYMNTVDAASEDLSRSYIYYTDGYEMPPEYTVIYSVQDYTYFYDYYHVSTWYSLPSYDERGLSAAALNSAAIVSSSDKKEEGKAFIAYLLSEETNMDSYDTYGIPVNTEALEMITEEQEGAFEFYTQATENVYSMFVVDADLRYVCRNALNMYFQGDITADETADMIEQGIDTIIGGES